MTTPDGGFEETGGTATIQIGMSLVVEQEIPWSDPPPQIVPLRYFRAVMSDYRVLSGIPKAPPVLDCAVPVFVTLDPSGAAIPSITRPLPGDVDNGATVRWLVGDEYISLNPDGTEMDWLDIDGSVAWTSYDLWNPQFEDDYTYTVIKQTAADEVLLRPALVFDQGLGNCMNTSLSINDLSGAEDIEFWFVVSTDPLVGGQLYHSFLDIGDEVIGFHDLPWTPPDSLPGRRLALQRDPNSVNAVQDSLQFQIDQTMSSGTGRPLLVRVRYGVHPMLDWWGPKNSQMHLVFPTQSRLPLSMNFVLGREHGQLDPATCAGMHLFEVNYFDHMLSSTEAAQVTSALLPAYAITG